MGQRTTHLIPCPPHAYHLLPLLAYFPGYALRLTQAYRFFGVVAQILRVLQDRKEWTTHETFRLRRMNSFGYIQDARGRMADGPARHVQPFDRYETLLIALASANPAILVTVTNVHTRSGHVRSGPIYFRCLLVRPCHGVFLRPSGARLRVCSLPLLCTYSMSAVSSLADDSVPDSASSGSSAPLTASHQVGSTPGIP